MEKSYLINSKIDVPLSQSSILSLAFYFYYKNRVAAYQGGAVSTIVEATIKQEEKVLDYSKIDRRDGMGSRREVITFPKDKIVGLEYNTNLLCLRIAGKPTIQTQYEN